MSDTNHHDLKEAIQAALGMIAAYRGVPLGKPEITRTADFVTHDDGTITGRNLTCAWTPSPEIKALIDASLDGAPVEPPPVEPPPVEPPPVTPVHGLPAILVATLSDGTSSSITANTGDRIPLVASKPELGAFRYYGDGLCVRIENSYHDTPGDLVGDFMITVAGQQIFSGPLTIWARTNSRPFWLKPRTLKANPDLSLFPKYKPDPTASMYGAYMASDNSPMGGGLAPFSFGTTGERPSLGNALTQWAASYLANPTPENAVVVGGMSDAGSVVPIHVVNRATNDLYDLSGNPNVSLLPATFGLGGNPLKAVPTQCPFNLAQAQAHATVYCALAAEIYGTDYDKEELAAWCNYYNSLWQNWLYRLPAGCCNWQHGQIRGKGRGLVVLLYAAKLSDRPAYFEAWVQALVQEGQQFLAQTGIQIDQHGDTYPGGGFAPWQQDLFTYAVGMAVKYGYTGFQPLLDYFGAFTIDRLMLGVDGANQGIPHEDAFTYELAMHDASGAVVPNWAGAVHAEAARNAKFGLAQQQPEGSAALITALGNAIPPYQAGDFTGYPWSPTGYAAMGQGALAMVAAYGSDPRGQQAWTVFQKYQRINAGNPKYLELP